jgi:hypothetical protein
MLNRNGLVVGVITALTIGLAPSANAQTIALVSTRGTGNQAFTGALGMDFNVTSPITITRLGAFDSGQNGFSSSINVGIFNRNTQTLVPGLSAVLTTANSVLVGQSRFFDIADIGLPVGNYSIVAQGFSSADPNGNVGAGGGPAPTINGGGSLTFVGGGRFDFAAALVFPTIPDAGPANRYDAGTFEFTQGIAAVAPEPASLAFLGLGSLAFVGGIRRRRAGK